MASDPNGALGSSITKTSIKMKLLIPAEISRRIKLKNIKNGFGHDLQGFYADVWVDGKKIGYVNDDGWGGGADYNFDTELVEKILIENGWKERTHKAYNYNPYPTTFVWKLEDINFSNMADYLFELMEVQKKLGSKMKKGILWGDLNTNKYKMIEKSIFNDFGFDKKVLEINAKLLDNEFILNNNL